MSYLDIPNLYKEQDILMFKECYAMEKIHGTSAHISFRTVENLLEGTCEKVVNFFSGGEKHANFIKLFNDQLLLSKFKEIGLHEITIFGEAYGGKCQGMSGTYGKELKFIVFDVKVDEHWLSVPQAEDIAKQFGLEFVEYTKIPTEIERIDNLRDCDSTQAIRNGMGTGKRREGIVLRPLIELKKNNGERIIAKHKNPEFSERTSKRDTNISPEKLKVLEDAIKIAEEWVTPMRLVHILDGLPGHDITKMQAIIQAMIADVEKEGKGEIIESKEARTQIGKRTAALYKERLRNKLCTNEK